jgi:nitroreductase
VCPALAIEKVGKDYVFAHPNACISCYHCVAVCPADAVTCDEFPLEAFELIGTRKPATAAAARNLIMQRRSVREFKNKPVPRKLIEDLVSIALHAPTGRNAQGVHVTVITDADLINKVDKRITRTFEAIASLIENPMAEEILKTLAGRESGERVLEQKNILRRASEAGEPRSMLVFRGAPVLVLAHSAPGGGMIARDDANIAMTTMMLAANAHGLGATWIGYIVGAAKIDPTLKRRLGIPMRHSLDSAFILGWPKYSYKRLIPRSVKNVKWIEPKNKE